LESGFAKPISLQHFIHYPVGDSGGAARARACALPEESVNDGLNQRLLNVGRMLDVK
jgi:hypothetical protein